MRQTISGLVAAVAVMTAGAAPGFGLRLHLVLAMRTGICQPLRPGLCADRVGTGCNSCAAAGAAAMSGWPSRPRNITRPCRITRPRNITTSIRARPIPVPAMFAPYPAYQENAVSGWGGYSALATTTRYRHHGYGYAPHHYGYHATATVSRCAVTTDRPIGETCNVRSLCRERALSFERYASAHQSEPGCADIEREHGGVRDVEALDVAGHVEPRHHAAGLARQLPQALALGAQHQRQRLAQRDRAEILDCPRCRARPS